MRKFFIFVIFVITSSAIFASCSKSVDYFDYVSELRHGVYYYQDDALTVKVHCSERESPYLSDGVKGEINSIIEIFVTCKDVPEKIEVSLGGYSGEMNYRAVTRNFYLSFSGEDFKSDKVGVTLLIDGEEKKVDAENVRYAGVIDERTALKCVTEYDKELFEKLTEGNAFNAEIYIRLLYDGGCFYYVGVCDREGVTHAYLLNGENGRIIATKEMK